MELDSFIQENGSGEYLTRYGQRILVQRPYLVKYSLDVLKKKTKLLDIFDTNKKCLIQK